VEKVERREGLICICAECKKTISTVGDVTDRSQALVSHGICRECALKLYGDLFPRKPTEEGA
jgi:hypothetical protein